MNSIKAQLSTLIELAKVDGEFDGLEKLHILKLGQANGLSPAEIKEIVVNPTPMPEIHMLSYEERFEYLFNIVKLMKIDHEIYHSEINHCKKLSTKLGFKAGAVAAMSGEIYADPSIVTDLDSLKNLIKKYNS